MSWRTPNTYLTAGAGGGPPPQLPRDPGQPRQGHQYIYLLLSYDQGNEEDVYQYFARNFQQTASYEPSPGMRLLVYRVGYSEALPVGDG
ncbi:hypothetical protein SAMN05661080_00666 [Modestobacter sp. DSM 44400]|uniref:hypothetical protein n=1 Tax=Modestobacter sp. DSM 44400 TaxID=1550230 RepID=UPI00089D7816|nr:hypothetical protein [Modestobacter sp. DSM 44400]SDX63178.1 hypothetical protein SAMN05661080_00666 [Modestobacter sp. DSM 44400]